jgi:hypothetical protein
MGALRKSRAAVAWVEPEGCTLLAKYNEETNGARFLKVTRLDQGAQRRLRVRIHFRYLAHDAFSKKKEWARFGLFQRPCLILHAQSPLTSPPYHTQLFHLIEVPLSHS